MPPRNHHRVLDEYLIILSAQGNHEAYQQLRKRYKRHSLALANEILTNHPKASLSPVDIASICNDYFPIVVGKFNPSQCSFLHFWWEMTSHYVLNYIIELFYTDKEVISNSSMSLEDEIDDKHYFCDILAEKDDNKEKKKIIKEIRHVVEHHSDAFDKNELSLLKLILEGYSIGELEHSGMMAKSTLYITFKLAVEKLQKLFRKPVLNKR